MPTSENESFYKQKTFRNRTEQDTLIGEKKKRCAVPCLQKQRDVLAWNQSADKQANTGAKGNVSGRANRKYLTSFIGLGDFLFCFLYRYFVKVSFLFILIVTCFRV